MQKTCGSLGCNRKKAKPSQDKPPCYCRVLPSCPFHSVWLPLRGGSALCGGYRSLSLSLWSLLFLFFFLLLWSELYAVRCEFYCCCCCCRRCRRSQKKAAAHFSCGPLFPVNADVMMIVEMMTDDDDDDDDDGGSV
ncbi:uncharacterized protein K452DRAFT_19692 [Aplosporella prunicola CBS 121167]|uniref:Uncharacterized protein n=1 Tax=Aplosporella prunicola CBS 121167 TaxID=1176127 RepID=A0A6A6BI14_9PEZI|nr:uncharacterized protein K452DRAFT_19692 [Aplosporella prunicola CBS 121167]KAF2142487.1 hypothetical protein K452DRAFT_19692 [Aplosporella prunicola CBS 121167]